MIPVNEFQLLQFAAIVTDSDDIRLQSLWKKLIGDATRMSQNVLEKCEDLTICIFVEIQAELFQTFLFFILLLVTLTSTPTLVFFFKSIA